MCVHLNCVFIAFYLILFETEGDASLEIGTIMTFKCKYRHFYLNVTWFQNIAGSRSEKIVWVQAPHHYNRKERLLLKNVAISNKMACYIIQMKIDSIGLNVRVKGMSE